MIKIYILCLAFCIPGYASQVTVEDYHYVKNLKIAGFPEYKPLTSNTGKRSQWEFKHTLRMVGYACRDLDPQETDKAVRSLRDKGFTIVFSEANRYLFKDRPDEVLPSGVLSKNVFSKVIEDNRILSDACHKYGLKFFLHQTSTCVSEGLIAEHPDWAAIDLETGKTLINAYGTALTCINNDNFMAEFYKRLNRVISESNCDGIMQDEIQFFSPTLCGCKWCREKFKSETGYDIPPAGKLSGWLYRFTDNPSYMAWLEWRRAKVIEHMKKVREIMVSHCPDGLLSFYLASSSACSNYYYAGHVQEDVPQFADLQGFEFEPPGFLYRYYNPLDIAEMKYMRAVAEDMDCTPWTLSYDKSAGDNIWNWYLCMSQGSSRYWIMNTPYGAQTVPSMVAWERDHENILGGLKSAGNIGVLFSLDSRDRNPEMSSPNSWIIGFMSTCHALSHNHIPYKVLVEKDMTAKKLAKLDTLLLFNTGSLSDRIISEIRSFVKKGGTLVASADTSLYDEKGKKRKDFALSDVFGASYSGVCQDGNQLIIPEASPVTGEVTGTLKHASPFVLLQNVAKDVKIYGKMVLDNGTECPGILVRNYGKGRVVYFTGHPENKYLYSYYNHPQIGPGKFWKDNRDPKYRELICQVATYNNHTLPMMVDNLPRGVVAEVYNNHFGKTRGIVVHLANFLGEEIKEGIIPPLDDVSFPDVMKELPKPGQPIKVSVRGEGIKSVYLISPDFDEIVKMPFKRTQNVVTIELPVFYRYFILYFNQGDEKEILKTSNKILDSIPPAKQLVIEKKKPLVGEFDPKSTVVFADSSNIAGGHFSGQLEEELSREAYGSKSGVSVITANISLETVPENPVIDLGAMDDNGADKCPIEIRVNGKTIFYGNNDYPDNKWDVKSFAVQADFLKPGDNMIEIANMGDGPIGNRPWFAVNFIRLRPNPR